MFYMKLYLLLKRKPFHAVENFLKEIVLEICQLVLVIVSIQGVLDFRESQIPGTSKSQLCHKNMDIVAAQRYMVSGHLNFFSSILINVGMRLKFRSTTHLKLSKYLYQDMFFRANLDQCGCCGAISNTESANFFFTDHHQYVNEA